ncbi:MAG TPA: response regulator transcription factor [Tepidisphaeraceae bacterium]|nr:response regulator transcription factor [Tepidisphaeraceae bacterium]
MSESTVLVIDDEKDLLELVRYNLEKEHLSVIVASDGKSGLEIAQRHKPDLILLDLMMPGMTGLQVCQHLRGDSRTSRIPVLILTAKAEESDKIVGLEMGGDDYVTKPFSVRELVARVRALLRRTSMIADEGELLRRGDLTIDSARHLVTYGDERVSLTATEFRILHFLASRRGRVLSRDDIIEGALGRDSAVFDRTIDVHITSLRRKLGPGGWMIETVRGFGYRLTESSDETKLP